MSVKRDEILGDSLPEICPRCGVQMPQASIRNALSRHRDIAICPDCGTDEGVRDFTGNPLPFLEWHDVRSKLAAGQTVYEITMAQTASVLVVSANGDEAMHIASIIPTNYLRRHTDWESTDLDEMDTGDRRPS